MSQSSYNVANQLTNRSSGGGSMLFAGYLDPYGNRTNISGSINADFAYAGDYYHSPSGLYLTLFRAYDSGSGRWLNRDPIGERGGINLYSYVGNSPLNYVDPFGLTGYPSGFIGPLQPGDVYGPYLPDPSQRPPGWNPNWPTGSDPRGEYSQDPNSGTKYYPHDDDPRHWPHYDDSNGKRFPAKCEKPRPGQKQKPYGDQSANNPWPQPTPSQQPTPGPNITPILINPITPIPVPTLPVVEPLPIFEPVFIFP